VCSKAWWDKQGSQEKMLDTLKEAFPQLPIAWLESATAAAFEKGGRTLRFGSVLPNTCIHQDLLQFLSMSVVLRLVRHLSLLRPLYLASSFAVRALLPLSRRPHSF
jgi:hypothetical protein